MDFFKKHIFGLLLALIILGVVIFSVSTLTTKPRLWTDEGLNLELARNFLLYGKLDITVAPGVFSGVSFLLQPTGYPLTVPLAGFFKIFGFGLVQARLAMLGLMAFMLWLVYRFCRRLFGEEAALISMALIATFGPFYGNGRCTTGEIAGFIFLILGLVRQDQTPLF